MEIEKGIEQSTVSPTESKTETNEEIESISPFKLNTIITDMLTKSQLSINLKQLVTANVFIIVISFMNGLYDIAELSFFYYQKNSLGLEPQTIQMLVGIINLPWCIKPIFGYLCDQLIKWFKGTREIIFICSVLRIVLFFIFAHLKPNAFVFYTLCLANTFCKLFENIVAEYSLVVETKKKNKETGNNRNNQLPIFFGYKSAGILVGTFLGGRMITPTSIILPFYMCMMIPFINIFVSYFYMETPIETEDSSCSFRFAEEPWRDAHCQRGTRTQALIIRTETRKQVIPRSTL